MVLNKFSAQELGPLVLDSKYPKDLLLNGATYRFISDQIYIRPE